LYAIRSGNAYFRARAALVALGLQRRAKEVLDLGDSLNVDPGGDRGRAIAEHERLRGLFEKAMGRLTERLAE